MTTTVPPAEDARPRLLAVAFRMLGDAGEAEDAVQEAYARWFRLTDAERADVREPAAWLTTVTSRICLDVLGSARHRRETYVGPWLPEPLPAHSPVVAPDPADLAVLGESVDLAVLVALEALTPAQRVAWVLHDVFAVPFDQVAEAVGRTPQACRALAAAARRALRSDRRVAASRDEHARAVAAFQAACLTGDVNALVAVLDPSVVLTSDGGGLVSAARRPVRGADAVARFLLGLLARHPRFEVRPAEVGGRLVAVVAEDDAVDSVLALGVTDGVVTDVWIVRNPHKLTAWS
ncbi:RNA polymerase sigma factor SigJ [Aeromicrobium sp. IC_218]|uniref:RNA polymerase sigma factor SigJ n=1 Tax=Aeromicrobium sp. IC_218 TaxID=2545468 RepID=UPI00103D574E|nr:RNA polymerase sigma factor SigJ [Aeromicrobium sp. IC_218]TCJ00734.1 RNA polymerase sigma factor SigJ [Aeromicrobium sp. IC_218]